MANAPLSVLGFSGSLRQGSYNTALLKTAQKMAPADLRLDIVDADWGTWPIYNADIQAKGVPAAVTALGERIKAAHGLYFVTPEYNYTLPGGLKNMIDWLSRLNPQPFAGKPIAVAGAAAGVLGTGRAQYDLRRAFVFLDGIVLNKPEVFVAAAHTKFDKDGNFTDEAGRTALAGQLAAFAGWIRKHG